MRNLKKVLALVVAVAMFASFACVASAGYTDVASTAKYADAVNLLSNLGIITGYEDGTFRPEETVKRSEAAAMMVRMLGLAEDVEQGDTVFTDVDANHWASGYINVAVNSGIINGMGDGTFAPEATLTYGQIVKMIVCALGYEPVAAGNGGWAGGGYLVAGSKAGFTKGVNGSMDSAASRATVAMLMYKALEVELMEQDSYSTGIIGDTFRVQKDKTILSEYLELEKVEGVIIATYLSDVDYEEGDNTVEMFITKNYADVDVDYDALDYHEFVADGTSAAALLGYSVVAYVGENEDGDDEMFAVSEKANKNSVVTIDTDLIKSFGVKVDNEGDEYLALEYYKSETSRNASEAVIQNYVEYKGDRYLVGGVDSNFVINGFNYGYVGSELYTEELWRNLDSVDFLDNDNDGDFEFVFAVVRTAGTVEFVVEETDNEDYTITGIDDTGVLELPYEDTDKIITIIKDGKIVGFDAIVEGDVVTCLDETINVLTVYVSSNVIDGMVDEVEEDTYVIGGSEYQVSRLQDVIDESDIEVGDKGDFYLNYFGKIVYVDTDSSVAAADTVLVIDADYSAGDFGKGEFLIKVVTAAGEVEVLTLKSKKIDVYTGSEATELDDATDEVVFNYVFGDYDAETNEVSNLNRPMLIKIDTTANGEIDTIFLPGCEEEFVVEDRYATDAIEEERSYNEARGTYGTVDLEGSVLVFNIDTDEWFDGEYEDAVTVSTVASTFVDDNSYSFYAYGEEDEVPEVLLTFDAKASLDAEAPVMVVTKVTKVVADDEETVKITGIRNGEKVSVIVDPEEFDERTFAIDKYSVIIYSMTAGYATDVAELLGNDVDGSYYGPYGTEDIVADGRTSDEDVTVHIGLVTDTSSKSFTIFDENGAELEFYYASSDVNFITIDFATATPTVKVGKKSDVKATASDDLAKQVFVFVKTIADAEDEVTDVVVIKGVRD